MHAYMHVLALHDRCMSWALWSFVLCILSCLYIQFYRLLMSRIAYMSSLVHRNYVF